jgi:hypothetical protein
MMPQLYILAGTALVSAALGGTCAWQAQNWRHGEKLEAIRADVQEQVRMAEQAARAKEQTLNTKINEARNAATKRETTLRTDLAAAGRTADGLRDAIYSFSSKLPSASLDACRRDVATLTTILENMEREGRGMAESADRHRSDSLMYQDAWPK